MTRSNTARKAQKRKAGKAKAAKPAWIPINQRKKAPTPPPATIRLGAKTPGQPVDAATLMSELKKLQSLVLNVQSKQAPAPTPRAVASLKASPRRGKPLGQRIVALLARRGKAMHYGEIRDAMEDGDRTYIGRALIGLLRAGLIKRTGREGSYAYSISAAGRKSA
jgi:hypothetical protein